MVKLGIIGAMSLEVETLLAAMEGAVSKEIAGSVFHEGKLSGTDCVVVKCGIGTVNAALCVQILCSVFGVSHIVNTGIAGSLCGELDIGDMVISSDAMYHDFDCCVFGYPVGKVPGMPEQYEADARLRELALEAAEAVNPVITGSEESPAVTSLSAIRSRRIGSFPLRVLSARKWRERALPTRLTATAFPL